MQRTTGIFLFSSKAPREDGTLQTAFFFNPSVLTGECLPEWHFPHSLFLWRNEALWIMEGRDFTIVSWEQMPIFAPHRNQLQPVAQESTCLTQICRWKLRFVIHPLERGPENNRGSKVKAVSYGRARGCLPVCESVTPSLRRLLGVSVKNTRFETARSALLGFLHLIAHSNNDFFQPHDLLPSFRCHKMVYKGRWDCNRLSFQKQPTRRATESVICCKAV